MAKKLLSINVHGQDRNYWFEFYGDTDYLAGWRADGLVIDEICNVIPEAVVDMGLMRPWIFFQDLFNFKNPFAREADER